MLNRFDRHPLAYALGLALTPIIVLIVLLSIATMPAHADASGVTAPLPQVIPGLTKCPTGYAHASKEEDQSGYQSRYVDICIAIPSLSLYCLLPSVDEGYVETDIVECANTGRAATPNQIAQGYYADQCQPGGYVPCYVPCFVTRSDGSRYPVPCANDPVIPSVTLHPAPAPAPIASPAPSVKMPHAVIPAHHAAHKRAIHRKRHTVRHHRKAKKAVR